MHRPFRFGVQLSRLPADDWAERLGRIESLGFDSVFWPDHFGDQWDPTAALAAAAAVTTRLRVGSLVYDVDYRHPVVFAKAAATIHLLSGGRHEFGLGAGWMETDYREAGIPYDRPGVRIERLEEAIQIIRSMWTQEKTSFEGRHYRVRDAARAAPLPAGDAPRVLIGGGGRKLLSLAGRYADIVGINPALPEGRVTPATASDLAPDRVRQKIGWVREAAARAGRDPDALELNSLVFLVALTDDAKPLREGLAKTTGMSAEQVADCPLFITGSPSEVRERLEKRREETGISYIVIQGERTEELEPFAESIVAPLAGT
ncbi:MAG: TIGR03621 family F420-dependent LLM class oxidoreductase [Deltaproteobacteria bacterium]|nr:MAG: TIGR03621 family F420-dependent LLM class oxidoreductase [Deltaproteobacteria bacterium]